MKTREFFRTIGIVSICGALAGCLIVSPHQEILPAVTIDCAVSDAATSRPISGTSLQLLYLGPNGERIVAGEALSDQDGKAQLRVDSQTNRMRGSDWYFAGGYMRMVEVRARGYERRVSPDGFFEGKTSPVLQLTLRLEPIRNHYGAGLVTAEQADGAIRTLTFDILDGPKAGQTISIPFRAPKELPPYLGKKLYFLSSIGDTKYWSEVSGARLYDSEDVLAESLRDEPYTEVVREFGEVTDEKRLTQIAHDFLDFIPGSASGTSEVTAIKAYVISTRSRQIEWLQFTCDDATLAKLKAREGMRPVPAGTNKERPGARAAESPKDTPSWWTTLAVPPVLEEYQRTWSYNKERSERLTYFWIDAAHRKVYVHRRWDL